MNVEELVDVLLHFNPKMEVKLVDDTKILNINYLDACIDMNTNKNQCLIHSDTPTRWDKYKGE